MIITFNTFLWVTYWLNVEVSTAITIRTVFKQKILKIK